MAFTPIELSQLGQIIALPASSTVQSASDTVRGRHLSIEAVWTGTPTGVFSLVVSYDGGVNWRPAPGASAEFTANGNAQPAGGASSAVWNFTNVPGGLWAILYTASSGTGSLTLRRCWTT